MRVSRFRKGWASNPRYFAGPQRSRFSSSQTKRECAVIAGYSGLAAGGGPESYFFNVGNTLRGSPRHDLYRDATITSLRRRELLRVTGCGNFTLRDGRTLNREQVLTEFEPGIEDGLFIRPIKFDHIDPGFRPLRELKGEAVEVTMKREALPKRMPNGWTVLGDAADGGVRVRISQLYANDDLHSEVSFAGKVPDGVEIKPANANHDRFPRNHGLGLYAANEALRDTGLSFERMLEVVGDPSRIKIAIGSALGDLSETGSAGYFREWLVDGKIRSTSNLAFSLVDTSAAFTSAYCLGPRGFFGDISTEVAACATNGFVMARALGWILRGQIRPDDTDIVFAGTSDSTLLPWVMEAFTRATVKDRDLLRWAEKVTDPEVRRTMIGENQEYLFRRPHSPFSARRLGFTMGEGSFVAVLMSPRIARELGVSPRGLLGGAFTSSDGAKDSIAETGLGPYGVLGRNFAQLRRDFGGTEFLDHTFGLAHGTSTRPNAPAESRVWNRVANVFGFGKLPITAPKGDYGHTMGNAGGVQMMIALQAMEHGLIPRIHSLKELGQGADVVDEYLRFLAADLTGSFDHAVTLDMGFGGHNSSVLLHSARIAMDFILGGMDEGARTEYLRQVEITNQGRARLRTEWMQGAPILEFDRLRMGDDRLTEEERLNRLHARVIYFGSNGMEVEGSGRISF